MPWQNAGTPIQALGLVKRTGFDARTASRPANTQTVLNNVSLDIDGAGLTAIVGPSGAGKTSLLYVLSGLDRPDSGRVTIGGTDVYALNEERRSRFIRGHIGFVFQQYNPVPYLTVEENVMLPLSLAHRKADYVIFLRDGQVTHIAGRLTAEQIADGIRRTFVPAGSPPLVAPARSVGPMMVNAQPIQSVQPGRPVQRVAYPQQRKEAHRG